MTDNNASETARSEPKTKVFISYARADLAFVNRIVTALQERGFEPFMDLASIAPAEDWSRRLEELITKADTVIFVLSPDAVDSKSCQREIEFATKLNKRFVPIVCRTFSVAKFPGQLNRRNWISFVDPEPFGQRLDDLVTALENDIQWIRMHTHFTGFAQLWDAANRPGPGGLLLRPPLLTDAEAFLAAEHPPTAPEPTLLRDFVAMSRRAYDEEQAARKTDLDDRLIASSRLLAATADRQRREGDAVGAMLLALEALPHAGTPDRPYVNEAEAVLFCARQNIRERGVLSGHTGAVNSVGFAPDGGRIVTASADKTVRIWNANAGQEIAVLRGHEDEVYCAAFSPDGKRIVTASRDETARIWNATSEITVLRGHQGDVNSAAFSSDGSRIVTASADTTARIWDLASASIIAVLRGHDGWLNSAAFSPDGRRVVTASWDGTARVWDAAAGNEVQVLNEGPRQVVFTASFSPDGKRVITGSEDKTARVWQLGNQKPIFTLSGHNGLVNSAIFSPDGSRLLTGSADNTARIWDAEAGEPLFILGGHQNAVSSAAFSSDGRSVVTGSGDCTARLWDVRSGRNIWFIPGPPIIPVANQWSDIRDRDFVMQPADHALDAGEFVQIEGMAAPIFRGGWQTVNLIENYIPGLSDNVNDDEVRLLCGHDQTVYDAAFSGSGWRVVTASADGTARIWDTWNLRFQDLRGHAARWHRNTQSTLGAMMLFGHEGPVFSAAFSPDDTRIVTSSGDKTARLWDATNGKEVLVLRGHSGWVRRAAFSPDGKRVATASDDGTARVWDAVTGREVCSLGAKGDGFWSAAFSIDGQCLLTASRDNSARIWDLETGREIIALQGHQSEVKRAAYSPDGRRVVTASDDGTARIWDLTSGTEILALRTQNQAVNSAIFSPDGERVATASNDATARVWNAASGNEIFVCRGHEGYIVFNAGFSPDGYGLVTAGRGVSALVWHIYPDLTALIEDVELCIRPLRGRPKIRLPALRMDTGDLSSVPKSQMSA